MPKVHLIAGQAVALGLLLLLMPTVGFGGDDYYRWVDEAGEVHYSDAPPPESVRVSKADAVDEATEAQQRAERAAAEQEEKRAAAVKRRDRMLLRSYTTLADLQRTRDRRLESVAGSVGLAEHRRDRARRKVTQYENLLADLAADDPNRGTMERQYRSAWGRLDRRRQELKTLYQKQQRMQQRFARDVDRYHELTGETTQ